MPDPFDLIVIGGGVNGAGVARDAAGRGARVLLLEAGDLAGGTSGKSSKLVHGGLRYLEQRAFGLVREALHERETLWRIAPHIVWPLSFVLPVAPGMRPAWMLRAGLWLYDRLAGRTELPRARRLELATSHLGAGLRDPGTGFLYADCWVDDARLVVLTARDAAARGAVIRTRTPVTAARREGALWRVEAGGQHFAAQALVNAGGPGADDVARLAGSAPAFAIRRVRGSHIVVPRRFAHPCAYILQQPDGRIVFVLPFGADHTLIGTTDADHAGPLDAVAASEAEIAYLIAAYGRSFATPLTRADVVHAFAGVRALVDDGSGKPEAASRGYRIALSAPQEGAPLLGIYGGKLTSHRAVAEEAVNRLAPRLPALAGPAWTATAPLPGGDFPRQEQAVQVGALAEAYPFLGPEQALRLVRAYGTDAARWLGGAQSWAELGQSFGHGLSEAEVDWQVREEWARTADDVLWRRSKLGLAFAPGQQQALAGWLAGR